MMNKTNYVKHIIQTFNKKTGKSMRFGNLHNVQIIEACLNDDCSNVPEINEHIAAYAESHKDNIDFDECFDTFEKPQRTSSQEASTLLDSMLSAAAKAFSDTKSEEIAESVYDAVALKLEEFIKDTYGILPKKYEVVVNHDTRSIQGIIHNKFEKVLNYMIEKEPVFLVGPAGCGKNYLCEQVAEALGLDFYFSNALTQEYFLTGFTDANGRYQESQFYKAFTNGGIFFLDEMDACIPDVLLKLNAAIANGYFDFPAPIGYREAHKDFRVIAAGNTYGLGANFEYVGRNKLDMASLDRFGLIEMDYDPQIDAQCAQDDIDLVDLAHEVRRICRENGILFIFSYRALNRFAKLNRLHPEASEDDIKDLLRSCIFKSLGVDDMRTIVNNIKLDDNRYVEILKKMI